LTETAEAYQSLSSSFRVIPPEETVRRVAAFAARLGVTRVTDITRLDRVGVPVYASVRPDALPGSLCVNAGKGVRAEEAKAGAYMEAIELALAEYGRTPIQSFPATPRAVLDGASRPQAILDFCPRLGAKIPLDLTIECVTAEEVFSRQSVAVPAELVFLPYTNIHGGTTLFGSSSNGLASGNTVLEATVHGLAEVIERDVNSFQTLRDASRLVAPETFPAPVAAVYEKACAAGLELSLRFTPNVFGLPHFSAVVADPDAEDPLYVNGGSACHLSPQIAAVRAVCEALQSRLSFIHGGRDDLLERHQKFARLSREQRRRRAQRTAAAAARADQTVAFHDIPDRTPARPTLEACLERFRETLAANHMPMLCRVVFTQPADPVQVVRVIVPRLEAFTEVNARVGFRLRDYVAAA
jgi:ribosomal protein S12 methylthiotransferase accessory factor